MSKVNREWHDVHPMPKSGTEEQRITWHTEHAKHCGCRKIVGGVVQIFSRTS